jgi:hypothetical protein
MSPITAPTLAAAGPVSGGAPVASRVPAERMSAAAAAARSARQAPHCSSVSARILA